MHKYIEDTDSIETILSEQQLANYLTRDDKKKIMDVILLLTDLLLTRTNEREIYRCTFDIDPPPKALEKHRRISYVFKQCGYAVTDCRPHYGVYSWWAEK